VAVATPPGQIDLENPPEDLPTLGRVALTDPDPERRAAAGVLLAASENPQAVPLLRQALADKDPKVRHTLVKEIADVDFAPDATVDLLAPVVMKDADPANRVLALQTLAGIGGDRVTALATRLKKDAVPEVRVLAEKIMRHETIETHATPDTD